MELYIVNRDGGDKVGLVGTIESSDGHGDFEYELYIREIIGNLEFGYKIGDSVTVKSYHINRYDPIETSKVITLEKELKSLYEHLETEEEVKKLGFSVEELNHIRNVLVPRKLKEIEEEKKKCR